MGDACQEEQVGVVSNQLPQQLPVTAGHVRVESRVAVWVQCPICNREHSHILTTRDNLSLTGLRLWRVDCQGVSYLIRVPSASIGSALDQARQIADEHGLSQNWLSGDIVDGCSCGSAE
jgi:hypothetical protein